MAAKSTPGHSASPGEAGERQPLLSTVHFDEPTRWSSRPRSRKSKRPVAAVPGVTQKLGMYDGVFVPTTLNVLSILMFLRFGFVIGQAGFSGSMLLLLISYTINLLTVLSISAIATNGVVRGGGAYYMISRSLGPEFGGSIGVVFYIGQVLNAGLNVVGFCSPLLSNFGRETGTLAKVLPESPLWQFGYETLLLWLCTVICFVGPALFAKSSKLLFVVLVFATISVPVSVFLVRPYLDTTFDAWYTGPSWKTFYENMMPHYTKDAAGSDSHARENFRDLFGIFFPATAGVMAGASMSGDLRNPSRSIPKGTLYGSLVTFILYAAVVLSIAATVSRELLYRDVEIIAHCNVSPIIILVGEVATSLFSSLMGIIGAAKLLQAIARDNILPFTGIFSGKSADDNPLWAIAFTYALTQLTVLLNINKIAVYITMAFLMTFLATNLACFLLDISSAPNFRPSFRYFNGTTAGLGAAASLAAMFAADGYAASISLLVSLALLVLIHFYSPPKPWGDVSQALIYHQVRKYLLRLRQDHVKYWRPQILLLVDDPRTSWSLIKFCSHLKKGGLLILGHVIVVNDFSLDFPEIAKQRSAWTRLRDNCGIKAFVQISASFDIVWGVRNVFMGSGLGGMKPNITVLGFYDESQRHGPPVSTYETISMEPLPTDTCRKEVHVTASQWVNIVEDLLTMKTNLAIARGFLDLELPATKTFHESHMSKSKGYIDLYPIQMSAKLIDSEGNDNAMSINFDTYTLILQLGAILHTVPAWHKAHNLRVIAFVEKMQDMSREERQVSDLLERLRIPAQVLVVALEEDNPVYDVIAKGAPDPNGWVDEKLEHSSWWRQVKKARKKAHDSGGQVSTSHGTANTPTQGTKYVVPQGRPLRRRETLSSLQQMGVAQSMQSTRLTGEHLSVFYDQDSDPEMDKMSVTLSMCDDSREDAEEEAEAEADDLPRDVTSDPTDVSLNPCNDMPVSDDLDDTPDQKDTRAQSPLPGDGKVLFTFNEIPALPQHLILNCMMSRVSRGSVMLFSTLAAPAFGTHRDEKASLEYLRLVRTFCDGLPPIFLMHAQSLTVTTAL